jgi:hypothetical protein
LGEWTIFNEDIAAIPLGTPFNLSVAPNDGGGYVQVTADSGNSSGDSMYIYDDNVNGQPNAKIFVTQVWTGTYNPHSIGVWYNNSLQQWAVFNEDGTAIPAGSTFDFVVRTLHRQLLRLYACRHYSEQQWISHLHQ